MSIVRAKATCPYCNKDHEIWYRYGKVVPTELIQCEGCGNGFSSSNFTSAILDLKANTTLSAHIV